MLPPKEFKVRELESTKVRKLKLEGQPVSRWGIGAVLLSMLIGIAGTPARAGGGFSQPLNEGGESGLAGKRPERELDLTQPDGEGQAELRAKVDDPGALLKKYREALENSPFGAVPKDLIVLIAGLLKTPDLIHLTQTCREMHRGSEEVLSKRTMRLEGPLGGGRRISETSHPHLWKFLHSLVEVGPVSAEEAAEFRDRLAKRGLQENTRIQRPIERFRLSEVVTVGLYREVIRLRYPPGSQEWEWIHKKNFQFTMDPLLPLIKTTLRGNEAFAEALSELSGRRFKVIAADRWELALRGRENGTEGPIQATCFSVGKDRDNYEEARAHGWLATGGKIHRVDDHPVGSVPNGYGVRRGNVFIRDASGELRGGGVYGSIATASAAAHFPERRYDDHCGFRLSEDY